MKAKELIGKKAIRTAPAKFNGDRSYMTHPILIVDVCESHIKYKMLDSIFDTNKEYLLGVGWLDDNWKEYKKLFEEPTYREVERKANVGEWVKIVRARITCGCYDNNSVLNVVRPGSTPSRGVYVKTEKTHNAIGCRTGESFIGDNEYVVLENYNSTSKTLSDYTNLELSEELLRRFS